MSREDFTSPFFYDTYHNGKLVGEKRNFEQHVQTVAQARELLEKWNQQGQGQWSYILV